METLFIDVDSGLAVKTITKTKMRGNETEVETSYSDFRTVDGLVFPFSFENTIVGTTQKQKFTAEKVEINPDLSDAQFQMPAPAPAAQPKPAEKPGTSRR